MPQFDTSTFASQIFWLLISFSILFGVVYFFVVPRITRNLKVSRDKLNSLLSSADFHQTEAEKLMEQYEQRLHEERLKINEIINKMQMDVKQKSMETEKNLHKKLDYEIQKVEQEIELFKEEFLSEFSKKLPLDISESLEKISIDVRGSGVMNQIVSDATQKEKKNSNRGTHNA